ncbi:hypothetical protein LPJ78_004343 [Coemansia sp. RSA 989]|nr:Threonyl/alanyl tRNA synthetase [Coemansia mojavensis]KAJ1739327.1 hypothetical protein LPJ68_004776 [Coemansia sp. RSA 1086]KAJ1747726.1 hypothetical protein LPJ79_005051 [Coemansia sp. RSA 1821]KAJ1862979.1 hypothetical protein LPJ78_004343 [Coemansia sp. RSA 989]KAJ1870791.1 hypothetical protein LPJ55_004386 [Coemansia sp. RSA 990]KAJ2668630.1 hypothetical protein IWW42_005059 [Coemansia sp. RSA 1085]
MATELLYFNDTYQLKGRSRVVEIIDTQDLAEDTPLNKTLKKHQHAVVLDRTLFYPQGGGQPTDVGQIVGPQGQMQVKHVVFSDKVYHLGELTGSIDEQDPVEMQVDEQVRLRNARCHSAGHVIFSIVKKHWGDRMTEKKGHHFSDGAYVEFEGLLPEEQTKESLEALVNEVVEGDCPVLATSSVVDGRERRVIAVEGFEANACGGTHVKSTRELGRITIRKIARKAAQNLTKVSYVTA